MEITEVATGRKHRVQIDPVASTDYKRITKSRYFFNWKDFKSTNVFKLTIEGSSDILGLVSLIDHKGEPRVEIKLLAVSEENVTLKRKVKQYEDIAGCLIAYACRRSINLFAENACVSLKPKTNLKKHYEKKYGMIRTGGSWCLLGQDLLNVLHKYL